MRKTNGLSKSRNCKRRDLLKDLKYLNKVNVVSDRLLDALTDAINDGASGLELESIFNCGRKEDSMAYSVFLRIQRQIKEIIDIEELINALSQRNASRN